MQWKTFYKKEESKLKKNEDKNLSFLLKTTTDCRFLSQDLRLVLSKSLVHCKMVQKSGFCYNRRNKKMQVYQQFLVDLAPAVCNFVINETLTCVLLKDLQTFFGM